MQGNTESMPPLMRGHLVGREWRSRAAAGPESARSWADRPIMETVVAPISGPPWFFLGKSRPT
jgi:hypothetical protein